jgi:hypothetical protein
MCSLGQPPDLVPVRSVAQKDERCPLQLRRPVLMVGGAGDRPNSILLDLQVRSTDFDEGSAGRAGQAGVRRRMGKLLNVEEDGRPARRAVHVGDPCAVESADI